MLTQAVQHVQGRPSVPSGYPRAIPTGSVAWPRPGITVRRTQTPRTKTLEPTVTERSVTETFALGHIVPVPPALVFPLALSLAGAVVPPALALVLAGAGLPPARLGDGGPRCLVLSLAMALVLKDGTVRVIGDNQEGQTDVPELSMACVPPPEARLLAQLRTWVTASLIARHGGLGAVGRMVAAMSGEAGLRRELAAVVVCDEGF